MEDSASTAVNTEATADAIQSQSPFAKQSWTRALVSLVIFWLALLLNITASYNLYITSSFVPLLVNLLGGCGIALGILEYFGVDSGRINRGLTQVIFNYGFALCYIFWNTSRDYPALYASVAVNYWCLNCVCLCTNPNQFLPLFVENPSPKAVNILLALCVLFTVQTCKESPHLYGTFIAN